MNQNTAHVLALILESEGGYQVKSTDNGNWTGGKAGMGRLVGTNLGVTPKTLAAWRKVPVDTLTAADMRALGQPEAELIYRAQYLAPIRFDALPEGLDYAVADACVNSGPKRAAELLQAVLGVEQDGIIGLHTLDALNGREAVDVIHAYSQARLAFLRTLPTWADFGRGWASRVARVEHEADEMATGIEHAALPELHAGAEAKAHPVAPSPWAAFLAALLALFTRKGA